MPTRRASWLIAVPPPAVYALTFVAGLAISRVVPMPAGWIQPLGWPGWILFIFGVALGPGSAALFAARRTTLIPGGRPSRLVTDGPYRLTRNPMYVGLTLAYAGLALILARPWPLILLPVPLLFIGRVVIPFEEARMRETFGAAFLAYCERVRRWI